MCRLFAWHSKDPISPDLALGEDKPNLITLSKLHRDGWGMAWCDESNQVRSFRDEHPAYSAQTLDVDSSTTAILHLRWATEEISVCIANTHPFVKDTPVGRMAFIHNGGIPRGDLLNSLIDEDLANMNILALLLHKQHKLDFQLIQCLIRRHLAFYKQMRLLQLRLV